MDMLGSALRRIEAQQKGKEDTAPWMVGEQLKDLLRAEPELAELVDRDLDGPGMGLADCEKKIKEYADKHRSGNFACVTPARAEEIIRTFYGLPKKGERAGERAGAPVAGSRIIDLADFL